MSEELKACPFCGRTDNLEFQSWTEQVGNDDDGYSQLVEVVFCNNHTVSAHVDIWQSRPLEDALRADLCAAKEAYDRLMDYRRKNTLNFQLEKLDDYLRDLHIALTQVRYE